MANSIGRGLVLVSLLALTACGAKTSPTPPTGAASAAPASQAAATSPSAAGPAASAPAPVAQTPALQQTVGANAVVRNTVVTQSVGETSRHPSQPQGPVRFLDQITTGDAALLEVAFRDSTTLSVGADSRLSVDRFVYDPSPGAAGVGVAVVRGVFRFASQRPGVEQESFRTPTAAIGVRGTLFDAAVGPQALDILGDWTGDARPADNPATAALIVLRQGVIEVRTAERAVTLRRPGQAVVVSGRHVSDPFYLSPGPDQRLRGRLPALPGYRASGYPGPGLQGPGDQGPGPGAGYQGPGPGYGARTRPEAPTQQGPSGRPYGPQPYPRTGPAPQFPPAGGYTAPRGSGGQTVTPGKGPGSNPVYRQRPATAGGGSSSAKPTTTSSQSGPPSGPATTHQVAPGGFRASGSSTTQPATTGYRLAPASGGASSQPRKPRPAAASTTLAKPAPIIPAKRKTPPTPPG